jgi:hypothetical protein
MKTIKIFLAGLLVLSGLFGNSFCVSSQDVKPDKQSRKEARKAQLTANFYVLDSLLRSGRFVLEADFLQNKCGNRVSVPPMLNFIRVEGPRGVLQTGSDTRQGYNGVGGVTAEGSIVNYKIDNDKKHLSTTVTFNLVSTLGNFDIFLTVSADNNATATISGSTSGRLSWDGHLVTLNN